MVIFQCHVSFQGCIIGVSFIFTPNLGEMIQCDEHIFQMGKTHQLVVFSNFFQCVLFFDTFSHAFFSHHLEVFSYWESCFYSIHRRLAKIESCWMGTKPWPRPSVWVSIFRSVKRSVFGGFLGLKFQTRLEDSGGANVFLVRQPFFDSP